MKKEQKSFFYPVFFFFPKTFDHSEYTAIGKSGGLQQPVAAACRSHCVKCVWNRQDCEKRFGSVAVIWPASMPLARTFREVIHSRNYAWTGLRSTGINFFFLFHYLFRHWLGWEPKPTSTLLGGIFHLIWKHAFVKLAQVSLWSAVSFKFSFSHHLLLLFDLNRNTCLIHFGSPADALGQS